MSQGTTVTVYGADWCADCRRVKDILDANGIAYDYKNSDEPDIKRQMLDLTDGKDKIPTVVIGDKVLQEPSNAELLELFDIKGTATKVWDVVMIGAGPAALAAAVYTTREDISTLIFERAVIGGLAAVTDKVDNYPGFPEGIEGLTLAENLRKQAERFGANIELGEVTAIHDDGKRKRLETTSGDIFAKSVLIATGSDYKKIGVPGEKEYYARGVHYCATCDGAFYRDKRLVVVGGGNSAIQESIFLTRFASHIDLLVRSNIKASDILQQDLQKFVDSGQIAVHLQTRTDEIIGEDGSVTKVVGTDSATGKQVEFATDGVFIFVGLKPNSQFLEGSSIKLDDIGFVKTDAHLQTSMRGVFAAGDIRSGSTMQIASAVGEGATAALIIREYLEGKLVPHAESAEEVAAPVV